MKKVSGLFRSFWFYSVLSVFLSFLMVFLSLPQPLKVFALGSNSSTTSSTITPPPAFVDQEPPQPDAPPAPPITITSQVSPDKDNQIVSSSGKVKVSIPQGAVSTAAQVEIDEYSPETSTGMVMLNRFDLNASAISSGAKITKFNKNLTITIQHTDADFAGLDVNSLNLYYQDNTTGQWIPVPSKYDPNTKILTATVNHFTNYGEQANPTIVGPGKILASQVNLSSGGATFSYPLELPAGPGGFTPQVQLTYNSGTVDSMTNKKSVGSWVGIGWSLSLGSISYDDGSKQYSLDFPGGSYPIVSSDGLHYHTNPDAAIKITRNSTTGNTWEVWDTSGFYYRFGGTTDSQQMTYGQTGTICFRWDMSLMKDTNGNQAAVSYVQDSAGYQVERAAYPQYLTYGNITVHFISSYDINGVDGHLRTDDPLGYYNQNTGVNNPMPSVMDTRHLDSIEIKINTTTQIRKYTFSYTTTATTFSTDYGGIYYAGTMILNSVTQYGADFTTALPSMTFSYQNKEIYRKASHSYAGNPGNPSTLYWPYLTQINNGYGGTVTFAYAMTPGTTYNNIWNREVVTTKTISSGIGPDQVTYYTYTGNPKYLGVGWDQKFKGFTQVRETDSAGNYINHYFYTTGVTNNEDGDKLNGKEYKTEWYSSAGTLLKTVNNNWSWATTSDFYDILSGWGESGTGNGFLNEPLDIKVGSDGYVYVLDALNNRIQKFDEHGNYVSQWNIGTQFGMGIAVSGGYVYVTIGYPGYDCVKKYDTSGNLILTWGGTGSGNGQFKYPMGIAVSNDGYVYVCDYQNFRIQKFDTNGNYIAQWSTGPFNYPHYIAVSNDGYIYVTFPYQLLDYHLRKYDMTGNLVGQYCPDYGTDDGELNLGAGIVAAPDGNIYIADGDYNRLQEFDSNGNFIRKWKGDSTWIPYGVAATSNSLYVTSACMGSTPVCSINEYIKNWKVQLDSVEQVVGTKTSQTAYSYDAYGNQITEYDYGDTSTNADDSTIWHSFYPNTTTNVLNKPASQRTYAGTVTTDSGGSSLKAETLYYYDGNNTSLTTPPTKGNLTRQQQKVDASNSVSTYNTYDTYGNTLTSVDGNGNTTTWAYDTTYHLYPTTKIYPISGLQESYTFDPGTDNMLTKTDINGQTTIYQYDTFKRQIATIKPGDTSQSPSIQYQYNNWGTLNQQNLKTITKIDATHSTWQSQFFDGVGRVVQVQSNGETGYTIISSTTAYNNLGSVDKQYVSQNINSTSLNYTAPDLSWKYTGYAYDGLGRVTTQTNDDGTTVNHDYSTAWQELITNELGYKTHDYYDANQKLVKVEELDASQQVYSTTNYTYDVLGNLTQVVDNANNTTSMTYDMLSRKIAMTDPDMGSWTYGYDSNGNMTTQTDALNHTITLSYDSMNRLTGKTYPQGLGMINVSYAYDSTAGGNYGKGQRTGMADATNNPPTYSYTYSYDARSRLSTQTLTVGSTSYPTGYTYDGADRVVTISYPTGETVTNGYNNRGLPYSISGDVAGSMVTSTFYNQLGNTTEIDLGNTLKTTYGYYGLGGTYDTIGGYYGQLWEIKTLPQAGGTPIQDLQYTWDAGGNMTQLQDLPAMETENFTYDFLDRLTGASGAYTQSYSYDQIGNITAMNGTSYTYGTKPQAVTSVGSTTFTYDANGNMTGNGGQGLTWDLENRPTAIGAENYVYDGDGNRIEKTVGGVTTLYINKYYELNTGTSTATTSYYLGDKLVATCAGTTLTYIHQDSLSSTSVTSDSTGALVSSIRYMPFGDRRNSQGTIGTDKQFTGQRLDGTGLYYYNARYYNPAIGRFVSADTIVQSGGNGNNKSSLTVAVYTQGDFINYWDGETTKITNPQNLNRYIYCGNNPLKFTDPTGHVNIEDGLGYDPEVLKANLEQNLQDINDEIIGDIGHILLDGIAVGALITLACIGSGGTAGVVVIAAAAGLISTLGAFYEEGRGVDSPVSANDSLGIWSEGSAITALDQVGLMASKVAGMLAVLPGLASFANDIYALVQDINRLSVTKQTMSNLGLK